MSFLKLDTEAEQDTESQVFTWMYAVMFPLFQILQVINEFPAEGKDVCICPLTVQTSYKSAGMINLHSHNRQVSLQWFVKWWITLPRPALCL